MKVVRDQHSRRSSMYLLTFFHLAIQHDAALFGLVFSYFSFSLLFDMDVMIPKSSLFAL